MTTDPFEQNLSINDSMMPDSQLAQAGRDLIQNHTKNIFNTIIPPLDLIKGAVVKTYGWFQNLLPETKHDYSNIVQFDSKHLRTMEQIAQETLELKKLDFNFRADTTERLIQLQNEANQFQKERLEWEKSVTEQNLRLIKESQAKAIEEKDKERQMQEDMHYLPFQVSRKDILKLLSQEIGKFVIIPSPPKIPSEIEIFQYLERKVSYKLKHIIETYYSNESVESPIAFKDIFKSSIKNSQASVTGEFLVPIPTLIFHTEVTSRQIFISITITSSIVELDKQTLEKRYICKSEQIDLPPWDWMELKKEIELQEEDTGLSEQKILDLIAAIHAVVATCFSDLYCLNLNPHHIPKLLSLIKEHEFPEILQRWSEPFQVSLQETQNKIQNKIQDELNRQLSIGQSRRLYEDFTPILGITFGLAIVMMFLVAIFSQQLQSKNTVDEGQEYQECVKNKGGNACGKLNPKYQECINNKGGDACDKVLKFPSTNSKIK
jgi:hypothetical protein